MAATVAGILLTGTHGSRPSSGVSVGTLYACSTHSLIYQTSDTGSTWGTWATLGVTTTVATDAIWDAAGDLAVGSGADAAARLAKGSEGGHLTISNGAVAWNAGTANPTALTNARFWRTDLGFEIYYDGTRWLTTQLYSWDLQLADVASLPIAAASIPATTHRGPLLNGEYDIYITKAYYWFFVTTTNNGTNYYSFTLKDAPGAATLHAAVNTSAVAANTHLQLVGTVNALVGTTDKEIEVFVDKVGTPGTLYLGAKVFGRLVVT